MLVEKNIFSSNSYLLLSKSIPIKLKGNYIDIITSSEQDIFIINYVIANSINIYLKKSEQSIYTFLENLFTKFLSEINDKTFFLLKQDEILLSSLYREYRIKNIKTWFMSIEKTIIEHQELPVSEELISTIAFELHSYNEASTKRSTDFYFLELLLQRFEERIKLSQKMQTNGISYIPRLLAETDYQLCFTHTFSASKQVFTPFKYLDLRLVSKLRSKGVEQLYSYQMDVFKAILHDQNVVITAPTGNGKTESFFLPILHKLLSLKEQGISGIKIILFYPTKALASDQLAKIHFFTEGLGLNTVQLDSDVVRKDREIIYQNKQLDILITTPDLIHYSLNNQSFRDFIAATQILVFDEIHTYTGTFGTHIYYFLRRVERILQKGSSVQYIAASATIGNPVEFTSKIFAKQMLHINCKTPKKNRTELFCIQRKKEASKYEVLFQLVTTLTQMVKDEKIIIFRNSQQESEKTFEKLSLIKNKRIALHRAGLTKEQRITIEKQLRANEIDVVVTTTTLEVGIDIGGITTIITPIVPVNRLLQRIGRAGRGDQSAKIFLELEHDPIAYYYSTHADAYLNDVSPVNITTENKTIASQHGSLLVQERSEVTDLDKKIFGFIPDGLGKLFSLRNVADKIVVKTEHGYKVTEKELPSAFYEFFPFNHILHNSKHYQIDHLEKTKKQAFVAIVKPLREKFDYKQKIRPIVEKKVFTDSNSVKVEFIGDVEIKLADCKVRLKYQGNIVNYREQVLLDSYDYEYTSRCVVFNFEDKMGDFVAQERSKGVELGSIVHTLSHVLYKSAKMVIHCGNDLINMENSIGMWKIVFVDNAVNGNGMGELLFEKREEIWDRALEILYDCDCRIKEGCLKCTMDYGCQRRNKGLIKFFQNKQY